MFDFNIKRDVEIEKNSFRVQKLMADFDVDTSHLKRVFKGQLTLPEQWQVGLIVGASGTGKTTIATELYGQHIKKYEYTAKSVIDDMPKNVTMDEIERMFYAVGFGSVPCWLKPYSVLSNGEKMRVDLARALLSDDFVVFDEFTSVVDRNVANVICIAVKKALAKYPNKKFIAVGCHKDVVEWLQPDWVFDTDVYRQSFPLAHDLNAVSTSKRLTKASGQNLAVITI